MLKNLTRILTFCCVIVITACVSTKIDTSSIPPEYNKKQTLLILVMEGTHNYEKQANGGMKAAFEKYYTGKYEMVSLAQIDADSKCKDKEAYRYILSHKINVHDNGTRNFVNTGYYLYDRLTDKSLPYLNAMGTFSTKTEKLAIALNEKLARS